ncbi:MAG: PEP-CTERM/exosortase system-associated acyltransferase [Halopseudomonas sp.]
MIDTKLTEYFDRYFYIRRADSDELRVLAYQVRYQVYCKELEFEDKSAFPNKLEFDQFDNFSDHFLIFHRGEPDEVAGTVRLVRLQHKAHRLPIAVHCLDSIDRGKVDIEHLHDGHYGELSRLAVTGEYRRRRGEEKMPFVVNSSRADLGSPNFPYIAVGLYMAAAAWCYIRGTQSVIVMMEPRLARHLSRFGILFEQVGSVIDYHGRRAPYRINQEVFFRHIKSPLRSLYDHVAAEIGISVLDFN